MDGGTLAHIVRFIYTDMLLPDVQTNRQTLEAILKGAEELRMQRLQAVRDMCLGVCVCVCVCMCVCVRVCLFVRMCGCVNPVDCE